MALLSVCRFKSQPYLAPSISISIGGQIAGLSLLEILFVKKIPLQDLLNAVISTNESTQFITSHVIYTYEFQLKTTFCTLHIAQRTCSQS